MYTSMFRHGERGPLHGRDRQLGRAGKYWRSAEPDAVLRRRRGMVFGCCRRPVATRTPRVGAAIRRRCAGAALVSGLRHSPHALQVQKRKAPEPGWVPFCFGFPSSSAAQSREKVLAVSCYKSRWPGRRVQLVPDMGEMESRWHDQCEARLLLQCITHPPPSFLCKMPKASECAGPLQTAPRFRWFGCIVCRLSFAGTYSRWLSRFATGQLTKYRAFRLNMMEGSPAAVNETNARQ